MRNDVSIERVRIDRVNLKSRLVGTISRYFTFEVVEAISWVGGYICVVDEEHRARINGVQPGNASNDPESHLGEDSINGVTDADR
jgi:hypothetical protein